MPTSFAESYARDALDARPDRLDLRDRAFTPRVQSLEGEYPDRTTAEKMLPKYLESGLVLDQQNEGACTGFGIACVINYLFWRRSLVDPSAKVERVSTRMLYHLAQYYDEWPGEDYEGSSCRGALKGWHRHGVCAETYWPYKLKGVASGFVPPQDPKWSEDALTRPLGVYYRVDKRSVVDMQAAIREIGAIYVSASVHGGWDNVPTRLPKGDWIAEIGPPPKGGQTGGHAFALVGYTPRGFIVQNSWGPGWGTHGFALLPYEDWVAHGTDSWVCALGVPRRDARQRTFIASPASVLTRPAGASGLDIETVSDRPSDRWDSNRCYARTVVMDNDGKLLNRLVDCGSADAAIHRVVCENALDWFKAGRAKVKRLAIYAHGGLNSESDCIERISAMGRYFETNGAYPVFIAWRTGPLETIRDEFTDRARAMLPAGYEAPPGARGPAAARLREMLAEARDRTLEVFARGLMAKALWTQMKQNAAAAVTAGGGSAVLVEHVKALERALAAEGKSLEVHLVGHSAGAIFLGQMLAQFRQLRLAVESCSLYAPACTVEFANETYARHFTGDQAKRLTVYNLSDENELADSVGPYGKSLLYLVSRALEDFHKMPLLGLAKSFEADAAVDETWNIDKASKARALGAMARWQRAFGGTLVTVKAPQVSNGVERIPSSHGSFDNNVDVVAQTLSRVTGNRVTPGSLKLDY